MPEFIVHGYLTISVVKNITARNKKEAHQKAEDLSPPGLCHQCSSAGEHDDGTWELNGFDDPPDDTVREITKVSDAEKPKKTNKRTR